MRVRAALMMLVMASAWAQEPVKISRVALSPVPLWPQDGDTSQLPKGQHVFFDPPSAEYVVYYTPDSAGGQSAQFTILRFGTHSLVDPEVTFTVAPTDNGHFHYMYKVENGATARQSIRKISIRDYSDSAPQTAGANWTAHIERHNERDFATLAVSASAIEWQSNSAAQSIAPASAIQGLGVDSTSLPGFVSMAFRGDSKSTEYTPDAVASLPKEVRDQLASVMNASSDEWSSMVIGPRFPKNASPSDIAQNYSFGMQWLIRRGKLDANSSFVQRAQALFSQQLQAGDQSLLSAGSISFTKEAKPGLEAAIANALETIFAQ
jgi:hypothetical protein